MDFFVRQRHYQQRSLWLYGLFFVAVLVHFLLGVGFLFLLSIWFVDAVSLGSVLFVVGVVLLLFGWGSVRAFYRLKIGGRALANQVGAKRLFIDSSADFYLQEHYSTNYDEPIKESQKLVNNNGFMVRDVRDFPPEYRRYYEFATQMSIASGVIMPALYVMPYEQGINGFVAGYQADDMVMVLTQGALEKLNDEGLYGLIAHEYGHILQGDAHFNMKMYVVLSGLQGLYEMTSWDYGANRDVSLSAYQDWYAVVERNHQLSAKQKNTINPNVYHYNKQQWVDYWQRQNHRQNFEHQGLYRNNIFTLLLNFLTFSSVFFAELIKHSFNRQREFLADATSVQLTRSPAVVETLKAIQQDKIGGRLFGIGTKGLSHFYFHTAEQDWHGLADDTSWFASHPSIANRIWAIDQRLYEQFAVELAIAHEIRQQALDELYQQRRQGTWQQLKPMATTDTLPLEFTPVVEKIVNGRLDTSEYQAEIDSILGRDIPLVPKNAPPIADLPKNIVSHQWINDNLSKKLNLPYAIGKHFHHPIGNLALMEAVILCHGQPKFDRRCQFDLAEIWLIFSPEYQPTISKNSDWLPHLLDMDLLQQLANLDRRLDDSLFYHSCQKLKQSRLNEKQIARLTTYQQALHNLLITPIVDIEKVSQVLPDQSGFTLWQAVQIWRCLDVLSCVLNNKTAIHQQIIQLCPLFLQNSLSKELQTVCQQHHLDIKQQAIFHLFIIVLIEQSDFQQNAKHFTQMANNLSRVLKLYQCDIPPDNCAIILQKVFDDIYANHLVKRLYQPQSVLGLLLFLSSLSNNQQQKILSSVHTLLLNNLVLHQNEYDVLLGLAEMWLGKRFLVD